MNFAVVNRDQQLLTKTQAVHAAFQGLRVFVCRTLLSVYYNRECQVEMQLAFLTLAIAAAAQTQLQLARAQSTLLPEA